MWAVRGYAYAPFSPKFKMGFRSDGPCECSCGILPNLKFVASLVPEIIAIGVLVFWVGVANPQSWGTGGRKGLGMVPFERALVSSYRPSIVTFPLPLRVSEILSLLRSSKPLFPTTL